MKKMPKRTVSIVIPTRNAAKTLRECLESLKDLNYPKSLIEIIITDGMSTDDTEKIAVFYNVKLVKNKKISIATGRNLGFALSSGELIAFTDADCIVDKNWISHCIKYFDKPSVAGVSGPVHTPMNQNSFAKAVDFLFFLSVTIASSTQYKEYQAEVSEVKDLPGCNAIYRAEALNKVMPLDENLFSGSDVELNYKLRQTGYKLLSTPDVEVWHYKRSKPLGLFHQMKRYAIGRLQLGKKYPLLRGIHIAVGLAIPFLGFFLASFFISRAFWAITCVLLLASLFVICGICLIRTRSIRITGWVPVAMAIMVIGWSCGFLRELIFPVRGPREN